MMKQCGLCDGCIAKLIGGLCGSLVQLGVPVAAVRAAVDFVAREDRIWQDMQMIIPMVERLAREQFEAMREQEAKKPS